MNRGPTRLSRFTGAACLVDLCLAQAASTEAEPFAESIGFASEHARLLLSAGEVHELGDTASSSELFSKAIERTNASIDPFLAEPPEVPMPRDPGGGYTHERHTPLRLTPNIGINVNI